MDASDIVVDDTWDDAESAAAISEAEPLLQPLDLLVWDAPNIDMTLSNVIGARPSPASRPRFDAVARWLVDGAGDRDVEGSVFTNVPPGAATGMRGWIEALRSFGYAVFAKPKLHHDDDVDLAMLEHIDERSRTHRLTRLVVASGDGRNFTGPLEAIARTGTEVVVLSFGEVAGYALESDLLTFVDLEDVPGAFTTPLDRVRLDALPVQGAWLRPTRSMREVAANTPGH
ncbi:MAG: NYN domain-containing protein [Rhodoferax sp.]|nr:NYN domain-containing protein [Actinomycetota bacterium]